MKDIFETPEFKKISTFSNADFHRVGIKKLRTMQEVEAVIFNREVRNILKPTAIIEHTVGSISKIDGFENITDKFKQIIDELSKKSEKPTNQQICELIETYFAGISAKYLGLNRYILTRKSDNLSVMLCIDSRILSYQSDANIIKSLRDAINTKFIDSQIIDALKFYHNGVYWMKPIKSSPGFDILSTFETNIMLENTEPGHWIDAHTYEQRHDIRTWISAESFDEMVKRHDNKKHVPNLGITDTERKINSELQLAEKVRAFITNKNKDTQQNQSTTNPDNSINIVIHYIRGI